MRRLCIRRRPIILEPDDVSAEVDGCLGGVAVAVGYRDGDADETSAEVNDIVGVGRNGMFQSEILSDGEFAGMGVDADC